MDVSPVLKRSDLEMVNSGASGDPWRLDHIRDLVDGRIIILISKYVNQFG